MLEKKVSGLEYIIKMILNKTRRKKKMSGLWEKSKWYSICVIEVPKGKEFEGTTKFTKEIMAEYCPTIMKTINTKIQ